MRIKILLTLLFVGALFAGDRLGGEILEKIFLGTQFRFAQIYNGQLEADIVILGNSRGIHMFHPPSVAEVTGQKVANISFNGMPAQMLPMIWKDYLEHHQPPQILVLEVSCIGVIDRLGSLEQFSILIDQNPDIASLFADRNPVHYWGCQISRLFRYNSLLFMRSQMFRFRSDQDWIQNSIINPEMLAASFEESNQHAKKLESNLVAIQKVIQIAKEHNVVVKPIVAPYLPEFFARLEGFDDWYQWTRQKLDMPLANYTLALEDPDCFSDHLHLNAGGAAALATLLDEDRFFDKVSDSEQ
ncbi:MAG: hypothetical protein AAF939_03545 [Planctomycetota bacterium]